MKEWVTFPYNKAACGAVAPAGSGTVLYVCGGYWSPDDGCPSWGTSDPDRVRFIGDNAGQITVGFDDGREFVIPLIFGYTLWYHAIWNERPTPFFDNDYNTCEPEYVSLLKDVLHLKGGFEGERTGVLAFRLPAGTVTSIDVAGKAGREGAPVFEGAYIVSGVDAEKAEMLTGGAADVDPADPFFRDHTIDAAAPLPHKIVAGLDRICTRLHTFVRDFHDIPPYAAPGRFVFSGAPEANAATGIVAVNMRNLLERTDPDGFIHTSYKDAPSWRYDGFGPYVGKANSYYDAYYSRDCARAIMTLNSFGHVSEAEHGVEYGNNWMMYYPRHQLTLSGRPIPGHFSVMPNKPLIYSTVLVPQANWPTRYTREKFGDDYQNLGNQETDGHGLMMLGAYNVWKNLGKKAAWVEANWEFIYEAAYWIEWCLANPDLSFAEDGLLYGETEAAMSDWTLYANLPCYLGLLGYAEMAAAIGKADECRRWLKAAETLKSGIDKRLARADGRSWDPEHKGFLHDPAPYMLSDFYGYDTADMPSAWIERSRASYEEDIRETKKASYYAPGGLGYGHSNITQNALLLDEAHDASELVKSLCRICYAPRLPEPYMVPEGISVDPERGILRRQGDLGNLVQQAEAMKCFLLVSGVSPLHNGVLKIMPRLPEGWSVALSDFKVESGTFRVTLKAAYPENGTQRIDVKLAGNDCRKLPDAVNVRFGPFPKSQAEAVVNLNGTRYDISLEQTGDSSWGWVSVPAEELIRR